MRPDTIKPLQENIGRIFSDINSSNIFFNPSPGIMEIKTEIIETYLNSKVFYRKGNNKQNEKTIHRQIGRKYLQIM